MSKILGNYCPVCLHNPCTCKPSVIPQHFDSDKINEEELDRLAMLYESNHDDIPPYANTATVWKLIREAYKAGYRSKAMEK